MGNHRREKGNSLLNASSIGNSLDLGSLSTLLSARITAFSAKNVWRDRSACCRHAGLHGNGIGHQEKNVPFPSTAAVDFAEHLFVQARFFAFVNAGRID